MDAVPEPAGAAILATGTDAPAPAAPSKRKKPSAPDAAALVLRETGEALNAKKDADGSGNP